MATVFLDRGTGAWITRSVPAGLSNIASARRTLLRAALPGLLVGISIVLIVLPFADNDGLSNPSILLATIPFTLSIWFFQAGLSFAQAGRAATVRSFSIILNGVLTLGITGVVLILGGDVLAALAASSLAYFIAGAVLWIRCARNTGESGSTQTTYAQAMRESKSLFGANIVTFAVGVGDILLASVILSPAGVGQYQIAKKVAQAATLPFIATLPVALGQLSSIASESRQRLVFKFTLAASTVFLVAGAVSWAALPYLLPLAFGAEFGSITGLVLVLLVAFELQFFRDLLTVLSNAEGRFRRGFISASATASTLLLGTVLLGTSVSTAGFAMIMVAAYGFGVVVHLVYFAARRELAVRTFVTLSGAIAIASAAGLTLGMLAP
jgi:O-antigen/teichoic acid export membrane protein